MRYEGTIYRPPGEWKSYLLQCTVGCSYNECTFCEAYKNKSFRVKPLDYVIEDINRASVLYPQTETVFLCDGDAIVLPMDYLLAVLRRIKAAFPRLRRVTSYAGPVSSMKKTPKELRRLCGAGLNRVYLGVETGDSELLARVKKGVDAEGMLRAGLALREAGFDLWVTVIAGLEGGGEAYLRNAALTARLLNRMQPQHLSVMTYMPMYNTPMYEDIMTGKMAVQSPRESLQETRELLRLLTLRDTHFTANHPSNLLPLKGTIDADTPCFLKMLDEEISRASTRRTIKAHMHG